MVGQAANWSPDQMQLAQELQADMQGYRANLPQRDGLLTINDVQLRGLEVVYIGAIGADFDETRIAVFRREVDRGLCSGATADAIRRGGAFTYDLRDAGGERFVVTISRCK